MNEQAITSLTGEFKCLSNFYGGSVMYDGLLYPSSEAAFQAAKTLDKDDRVRFTTMTPRESKDAGRSVALRDDWERIKDIVMLQILLDKFTRNPESRKKLLETGDAHLEEGNHHGDRCWGTVDGIGENRLGLALMNVRAQLRITE